MPFFNIEIPELNEHITDPVMDQVIHRVIATLGLTETFQDNVYIKTKYRSHSDTSDNELNAKLRSDRFVAEVNIQGNPNSVKWDITTFSHTPAYGISAIQQRQSPLFLDKEFGVALYEQAAPCSFQIQCTMHFIEKTQAYAAPLQLFNRYRDGSILGVTNLVYDYKLPDEVVYVLGEIYNKKRYTKNFSTFYEYLQYWSGGCISLNKNAVNPDRQELVILKHNAEVMLSVEYSDDEPGAETSLGDSPNAFTVPFNLTVQFNMPNTCYLRYPISIENTLLPIEAIPIPESLRQQLTLASHADRGIQDYSVIYKFLPRSYIQTPYYDDWVVPASARITKNEYKPFFIGQCLIDEDKELNTVDLKVDLGGAYLPDFVQDIIACHKEEGLLSYDGLVNVSVFYGDLELAHKDIHISDDLILTFKGRKLNAPYHIVLSELAVFEQLNRKYFKCILPWLDKLDFIVINQIRDLIEKGIGPEFTPDWLDGYFYDPVTKCWYDSKTGKKITCIGKDDIWYDENGNPHFPDMDGRRESHGSHFVSRIFRADIVCYSEEK